MNPAEALARYRELRARVDAMFASVQAKYPASFRCAAGCHACCLPGLSVGRLEAEAIADYLRERPELRAELTQLATKRPFGGARCSFLRLDGACGIYEARPLVCRSHGAPLQYRDAEERAQRDVCELNFTEANLAELPLNAVFNLDTLNTLLAVLALQGFGKDERRFPLGPGIGAAPEESFS